jgi:hypothetical protein
MDFRYLARAPRISGQTCTEADLALKEFHDHKRTIISSGAQIGKGGKVIDSWYVPKLKLLQSITSSIPKHELKPTRNWTSNTILDDSKLPFLLTLRLIVKYSLLSSSSCYVSVVLCI